MKVFFQLVEDLIQLEHVVVMDCFFSSLQLIDARTLVLGNLVHWNYKVQSYRYVQSSRSIFKRRAAVGNIGCGNAPLPTYGSMRMV